MEILQWSVRSPTVKPRARFLTLGQTRPKRDRTSPDSRVNFATPARKFDLDFPHPNCRVLPIVLYNNYWGNMRLSETDFYDVLVLRPASKHRLAPAHLVRALLPFVVGVIPFITTQVACWSVSLVGCASGILSRGPPEGKELPQRPLGESFPLG